MFSLLVLNERKFVCIYEYLYYLLTSLLLFNCYLTTVLICNYFFTRLSWKSALLTMLAWLNRITITVKMKIGIKYQLAKYKVVPISHRLAGFLNWVKCISLKVYSWISHLSWMHSLEARHVILIASQIKNDGQKQRIRWEVP